MDNYHHKLSVVLVMAWPHYTVDISSTWTNDDNVLQCHMAPQSHNELNSTFLGDHFFQLFSLLFIDFFAVLMTSFHSFHSVNNLCSKTCTQFFRPLNSTHNSLSRVDFNGLTHWGRDKIDAILQTTFWDAFSWMKSFVFWFKIHWSLFLRFQLRINQHWSTWWLGAE